MALHGAGGEAGRVRAVAWGARLIVDEGGHVDFVHDRQSQIGADQPLQRLLDYLNANDIPTERRIADMLQRRVMRTSVAQDFTIYADGVVIVRANTNGSCGYCYVVAYFAQTADEAVRS